MNCVGIGEQPITVAHIGQRGSSLEAFNHFPLVGLRKSDRKAFIHRMILREQMTTKWLKPSKCASRF
jgi:hypothetical protein